MGVNNLPRVVTEPRDGRYVILHWQTTDVLPRFKTISIIQRLNVFSVIFIFFSDVVTSAVLNYVAYVLHEAEKRDQFSFVCNSFNIWQKLVIFSYSVYSTLACINNFAW